MTADEFMRRYVPAPAAIRSNHDNCNDHEAARLVAKFGTTTGEIGCSSAAPLSAGQPLPIATP